jgi:YHS domain-containing protein
LTGDPKDSRGLETSLARQGYHPPFSFTNVWNAHILHQKIEGALLAMIEHMGMAVDLVCGMGVDEDTASFFSEYGGKKYYFCSRMCKEEFDDNPEKYRRLESKSK